MNKPNLVQGRKRARIKAVQALYQHELNPQPSNVLVQQFLETQDMEKTDTEYFSLLLKKVITETEKLDDLLIPFLDISLEKLDTTEKCILRIAIYELSQQIDIPFRIIINEAVSLAKKFGATDGHKYINGVLDNAAKELRPDG